MLDYARGLGYTSDTVNTTGFSAAPALNGMPKFGSHHWVQILHQYKDVQAGQIISDDEIDSLDTLYPYSDLELDDTPQIDALIPCIAEFDFSATCYFEWAYDSNSLFVPLGSVTWGFNATTTLGWKPGGTINPSPARISYTTIAPPTWKQSWIGSNIYTNENQ